MPVLGDWLGLGVTHESLEEPPCLQFVFSIFIFDPRETVMHANARRGNPFLVGPSPNLPSLLVLVGRHTVAVCTSSVHGAWEKRYSSRVRH